MGMELKSSRDIDENESQWNVTDDDDSSIYFLLNLGKY